MDICHCHGVTARDIDRAIEGGARSLFDLMGGSGAGTGCGNCQGDLRRALDQALARRAPAPQSTGCSSTSRMTPTRISVGTSLNTLK